MFVLLFSKGKILWQKANYAYWAINSARKIFLKSSSVKDGSFL